MIHYKFMYNHTVRSTDFGKIHTRGEAGDIIVK